MFDYNTTRPKLILSEYGRNVQNMVDYICTLPSKEERNKHAKVVIDLMGFLNPHLRDVADFKHKLWDHLHLISDFKIDVDSSYPKPSIEALRFKPAPLAYPHQQIKRRHYGKTLEVMIAKAIAIDEAERKQEMVHGILNFMKNAYVLWNKDSVTEDIILNDLKELSNGQLSIAEGTSLNWGEFQRPVSPPRGRSNNNNKARQNNKGYKSHRKKF